MRKKILIAGCLLLGVLALLWILPMPEKLNETKTDVTRILDRNGELLYAARTKGFSSTIPLERIPPFIVDALLSTEDRTFYSHPGVSLRGIARAFVHDIRTMSFEEGGSTVTQQLVRTLLEPERRGVLYKIREAWLALKYDAWHDKRDILDTFLNTAYFGQQSYGIQAAAKTYFDKDVRNLSLSEASLLIGLLNAPTSLNPFKNVNAAKERRDHVLRAMYSTEKISSTEYDEAIAEPLELSHGKVTIQAPHFVMWLLSHRPELRQKENVRTTLDSHLQATIERIVDTQVEKLEEKNVTSAAVIVLDAKNGDILSMVGSRDYFDEEHDGAVNVTTSARQPGSSVKPFTYALALSQGMTAASTVADIETQFFTQEGNPYIPRNYDFGYHGLVRLREALGNSYNIAAVKVLERVGIPRLLGLLKQAGITTLSESPEHYGLALTLGDSEVKPIELATAFGMFARKGVTMRPRALLNDPIEMGQQVLDPRVAWLISDILDDEDARTAEFGRDGPLTFEYSVAAKTGTTRNSRDNWVMGYTPERIVGVWVGNADNTPMRGTSGITGAGPIFHDVMNEAMKGIPKTTFTKPSGIVDEVVCRLSGKLQSGLCPAVINEHFIQGTVPRDRDDIYVEKVIDTRNNFLASSSCPEHVKKKEVFTAFPVELKKWARENGWKEPPTQYSPLCSYDGGAQASASNQVSTLTISRPGENASFRLDPLIPDESELVVLEAQATDDVQHVEWFIDSVKVGEATRPDFRFKWKPVLGIHAVDVRSGESIDRIKIEITE
jgi:penicillin-binding protein 1C